MNKEETKQIKEKIIEELEGLKEFEVSYTTEITYSKTFKAKSEEEVREQFENNELQFDDGDVTDENIIEDSLEVEELN